MVGIVSFGGFIPRYRLDRMAIFKSMGWLNTANAAHARGEKAVANYDEDTITMAVEAGIDCLKGIDRSKIDGLFFASTSAPYRERQNAGIVKEALCLNDSVRASDVGGALKAGTTSLLTALDGVSAGSFKHALVCAADSRLGKMGSPQELTFGDGASALLVGSENVVAEYKGSYSLTTDMADHYRGETSRFDRMWEERWIRDAGYTPMLTQAAAGLAKKFNLELGDFAKIIYSAPTRRDQMIIGKTMKLSPEQVQNPFLEEVGDTGAAQALIMLSAALQDAKPGDKIMVLSHGSGADAMFFEVTEEITKLPARFGIKGSLGYKAPLEPYEKYITFRSIGPVDIGLRGEAIAPTALSALGRHKKEVLGLIGTKCTACGTPQYPIQRVCVNPKCGVVDQMEPYGFSDKMVSLLGFTGDNLAFSIDPPQLYGLVAFDGGGRFFFDITDCTIEDLSVGMKMEMSFRLKYIDHAKGLHGYFWKAVPAKEGQNG
jgi:hydroxymethylglutaryl-CoA synthase